MAGSSKLDGDGTLHDGSSSAIVGVFLKELERDSCHENLWQCMDGPLLWRSILRFTGNFKSRS
jgi:hypothetical protein